MNNDLTHEIEILKNGGILIFPTDTAFGIGCRIDNHESVQKLFTIRQRAITQATPVLASSQEMVSQYVEVIPDKVKKDLMDHYWPGALTIILKAKKGKIFEEIRGLGENVGMRIPNNQTVLHLIEGVGVPIIGTSANFSGEPTPYSLSDLNPKLVELVDGVVEGNTSLKKESTVIDCSQDPWAILRQGAIQLNNL